LSLEPRANPLSLRTLLVFVAVVLLEFLHFFVVITADYMVYPVLDMGTTSVANDVSAYLNPWFFWFEFPFVIISIVVGLYFGSRIASKGWKVAAGYTVFALIIIGISLYVTLYFLTYDWIFQLVQQDVSVPGSNFDMHTFIQSAIGNGTVLSRYYWTAFQFAAAGAIVGLLGSQIKGEF